MALGRDQYESTNENINKKFPDSFVKWITSINDRKDIEIIELFSKEGIKIKHNPNISSMNFVISDKYFASTTEKVNGAQMISNFLVSNDPVYIDHFSTVFENAWKSSVEANERMLELKQSDFFKPKIISNPIESLHLIDHLYSLAKNEVLILLPSPNSLLRLRQSKDLEKLDKLAIKGIIVKILIMANQKINQLKEVRLCYPRIEFRILQFDFPILNRITIIDAIKTIIVSIKDDSKIISTNSIGMTTFIEGEPTAVSYNSIFSTYWDQTKTFEKLKNSVKELQSNTNNKKSI
jgi:hypothetical protein